MHEIPEGHDFTDLVERDRRQAGILLRIAHALGDAPTLGDGDLPGATAELVAERDRWRANSQWQAKRLHNALRDIENLRKGILRAGADRIDSMSAEYGCPDCGVHDACGQIVAERDRLRAVVDAVRRQLRQLDGSGDMGDG